MGSDVCEVQEPPSTFYNAKVHFGMCTQLQRLDDQISSIFPDIEAARPRCSSGIQALCQLHKAIDRARELVAICCESSKLYLVITGDTVVSRFERTRNLMMRSLSELQSMVPVVLEVKISVVLGDLEAAVFFMDSHEEVVGKALRGLLQQDSAPVDSVGESELEVLQFAASVLHLSSQKDLLIERRSLRKLLDEVKEGSSTKRKTLSYLLHILKKYDKQIGQGQTRGPSRKYAESCFLIKSDSRAVISNSTAPDASRPSYAQDEAWANILHKPNPPEEFKCHFSKMLMRDPVIVSSGQTFERAYIQKWFDDGYDTCPITRMKLPHLSVIPNTSMRNLILKWSLEHGIDVSEPRKPTSELSSRDASFNSINSSGSSMRDLHFRLDMSTMSLGSLDSSYSTQLEDSFSSVRESSDIDAHTFHFYRSIDDIRRHFLSNVNGLPWGSQCWAVQDVHNFLTNYNPSCASLSSENFLDPLVQFLKDALNKDDQEAQKAGTQLFLTFLRASRTEAVHINEDVYALLASFLAREAAGETLAIIEVLSAQVHAISQFAASGVLTSIMKLLENHNRESQEAAIRILYNLSLNIDASSCKLASVWIPILVPFLEDNSVAGTCIGILEKLCIFDETKVSIAETKGCIGSIIELLESGSSNDTQEHAVGILLRLCSELEYCSRLVLDEGGVTALCHVTANGSDKGKSAASELLRVLRDVKYEDEEECPRLESDASEAHSQSSEDKKSSKTSSPFRLKMKIFSKKK